MDDNSLPPDPNIPPAGGIPDDDEFLNSLFAEARPSGTQPQLPPDTGRGGKARDRYARRREKSPPPDIKSELKSDKTQPAAPLNEPASPPTPAGGTRRVRTVQPTQATPLVRRTGRSQVALPGSFKMPEIDFRKYGVYAYAGAAIIIVIGVIVFLGLFKSDPAPTYPNAIYIGSEWTMESPSDEAIAQFADLLRRNRIGTVYAWVGFIDGSNQQRALASNLNDYSTFEPGIIRFVSQFRAAYPQATLYGWMGFPIDSQGISYEFTDPATDSRLRDTQAVDAVTKFAASIVKDLGFDGVMLNAETVWNRYAPDYISLLQRVRREIGDALLSVAVIPDWSPAEANIPKPPQIAPGTEYSTEFKQQIALMVDEIMVMAYNSDLNTPPDYVEWVAYQTQAYAKAVAAISGGAEIRIGIPTYASFGAHDATVENIPSAISGVLSGIQQAGDAARTIAGVAIYASWETDEDEWRLFDQFWVQR